jgi:AraC-like DNA-binding protein
MQPSSVFQFAFQGLPSGPKFESWREEIGRHLLRCDYRPTSEERVHLEHRIHVLQGMTVGRFSTTPVRASRTRELIEGDSGELLFVLGVSGTVGVEQAQAGTPHELAPGGLAVLDITRPSSALNDGTCFGLRLDRRLIKPYCPGIEDLSGKRMPIGAQHTALLLRYLEIVTDLEPTLDAAAMRLVEQHIVDLLGLALGANGDIAHHASRNGLRAARGEAIRHSISAQLRDPSLSLSSLAKTFGISERYVQLMFEELGTSFTDYVLEQRLLLARRMLENPSLQQRRISDIAFDTGFGDLSHFNRSFRRRFGLTPSDVRKGSG